MASPDETPSSSTSRVEADIEIVSNAVGNQIENEPSTNQLKETVIVEQINKNTIAKSDDGTKNTLADNNVQK